MTSAARIGGVSRNSGLGRTEARRVFGRVHANAFAGGLARAREVLASHWGYPAFRPAQLRVLGPLLAGRDVLAILPTGSGKSLCFQVPALLGQGLTIVVSPLISLMQDQVGALRRRAIPAAYINSTLNSDQQRTILSAVTAGAIRLLYCAPERLSSLVRRLRNDNVRVALLAVDEAHCIVEWGNEFRPVYGRLGKYRYLLKNPPTIALTGSATPAARKLILETLRLRGADIVVTSFDRPNLTFLVERVPDERQRFARMLALIGSADGAVVLYAPTRRLTELLTRALLRRSLPAAPYHAGLTPDVRRRVLFAFLRDRVRVVVATTAFGMGIDKPDVRRVLHWGPSRTLEGYYQEAGRAGRDGNPAECRLFWRPGDFTHGTVTQDVRSYVTRRDCRRKMLLAYFGERLGDCAGCDVCGPAPRATAATGA